MPTHAWGRALVGPWSTTDPLTTLFDGYGARRRFGCSQDYQDPLSLMIHHLLPILIGGTVGFALSLICNLGQRESRNLTDGLNLSPVSASPPHSSSARRSLQATVGILGLHGWGARVLGHSHSYHPSELASSLACESKVILHPTLRGGVLLWHRC